MPNRDPDFIENIGRIPLGPEERAEQLSPPPDFFPGLQARPDFGEPQIGEESEQRARGIEEEELTFEPPASAPAGAPETSTGIAWETQRPGSGRTAEPEEPVRLRYTIWSGGEVAESEVIEGMAATIPLDAAAPGFSEVLDRMREGETVRMWIPFELGADLTPGEGSGPFIVDVELLEILPAE